MYSHWLFPGFEPEPSSFYVILFNVLHDAKFFVADVRALPRDGRDSEYY